MSIAIKGVGSLRACDPGRGAHAGERYLLQYRPITTLRA
jgi:hypothetical protein